MHPLYALLLAANVALWLAAVCLFTGQPLLAAPLAAVGVLALWFAARAQARRSAP